MPILPLLPLFKERSQWEGHALTILRLGAQPPVYKCKTGTARGSHPQDAGSKNLRAQEGPCRTEKSLFQLDRSPSDTTEGLRATVRFVHSDNKDKILGNKMPLLHVDQGQNRQLEKGRGWGGVCLSLCLYPAIPGRDIRGSECWRPIHLQWAHGPGGRGSRQALRDRGQSLTTPISRETMRRLDLPIQSPPQEQLSRYSEFPYEFSSLDALHSKLHDAGTMWDFHTQHCILAHICHTKAGLQLNDTSEGKIKPF